jgi:hypothetical protein
LPLQQEQLALVAHWQTLLRLAQEALLQLQPLQHPQPQRLQLMKWLHQVLPLALLVLLALPLVH